MKTQGEANGKKLQSAYAVSLFHSDDIGKDHMHVGGIAVSISMPYCDGLIKQLAIIQ